MTSSNLNTHNPLTQLVCVCVCFTYECHFEVVFGHRVVQLDPLPDFLPAELGPQLSLLLHILTDRRKRETWHDKSQVNWDNSTVQRLSGQCAGKRGWEHVWKQFTFNTISDTNMWWLIPTLLCRRSWVCWGVFHFEYWQNAMYRSVVWLPAWLNLLRAARRWFCLLQAKWTWCVFSARKELLGLEITKNW